MMSDCNRFNIRIVDEHLHSESLHFRGERLSDSAKSDQPQGLTAQPANARMSDHIPRTGFDGTIRHSDSTR